MADARRRKRTLPAGNWPPYVQACLRRSMWFRFLAVGVSLLGTVFFALALWRASLGRDLLGIAPAQAALALIGQLGATVFLALELLAAAREERST